MKLMKKSLAIIASLCFLLAMPCMAQDEVDEVDTDIIAPVKNVHIPQLATTATCIPNPAFPGIGSTTEGYWHLYDVADLSWLDFWGKAELSLGPSIMYMMNMANRDKIDKEKSSLFMLGPTFLLDFSTKDEEGNDSTSVMLKVDLSLGLLNRYSEIIGGPYADYSDLAWSAKATFDWNTGRINNKIWPWAASQVMVEFSSPRSSARPVYFLDYRSNADVPRKYSGYVRAQVSLFDLKLSKSNNFKLPLYGIFLAGQDNQSLQYVGGGLGLALLFKNQPMLSLSYMKVKAIDRETFNNNVYTLDINLSQIIWFWQYYGEL